jgi:hypothetical protein
MEEEHPRIEEEQAHATRKHADGGAKYADITTKPTCRFYTKATAALYCSYHLGNVVGSAFAQLAYVANQLDACLPLSPLHFVSFGSSFTLTASHPFFWVVNRSKSFFFGSAFAPTSPSLLLALHSYSQLSPPSHAHTRSHARTTARAHGLVSRGGHCC